jgi:hypothetical protein
VASRRSGLEELGAAPRTVALPAEEEGRLQDAAGGFAQVAIRRASAQAAGEGL